MASFAIATFLPILFILAFNSVMGTIALKMAERRGMRTVPAFLAGFFGSFLVLLIIAMFPVKEN